MGRIGHKKRAWDNGHEGHRSSYDVEMKEKEKATVRIRVYPSTHRRLRLASAKAGCSLANTIEQLSKTATNISREPHS